MRNIKKLLGRSEFNTFLFMVCLIGINFGYIESYLFVFLKTMQATGFLMGELPVHVPEDDVSDRLPDV